MSGGSRPGLLGRRALLGGALGAAWLLTAGHTPYKQWVVYRQRNLVIGSVRADPPTFALAERVADTLARHLPESRARLGRAPTYPRLGGLLATAQLQVAVLEAGAAGALTRGAAPFEGVGAAALRVLYELGGYLLVSIEDFPAHHAYLLCATLAEHAEAGLGRLPSAETAGTVPVHPGTLAFVTGGPEPEPPSLPK